MPLKITTNNGGDGYYYTTFYAPFDVELPSGAKGAEAFVCTDWDENGIHPTSIGQTIPAETPVIIRTRDESGIMTLVLPNASPSPSPSSSCVFTGEFLEQLLEPYDADRKVYTFGLYFTSQVAEDDPATIPGDITAPLPEFANNGVGFYLNATRNKEASLYEAMWKRNNRYVLHNKIYYRASGGGGGTRGIEFVPVIFDDENQPGQPDIQENAGSRVGDGRVYDLQGRCVATEEQVQDGTWRQNLRPGIYIINGKKIKI